MIDVRALERMSENALRTWLLARMRGEQEDPPLSTSHLETPFDFVRVARDQSTDGAFHDRVERTAIGALREAGRGDLHEGRDARAVRALAFLIDGLDLNEAAPVLHQIAARGALGGHLGALADDVESAVLVALAGLQLRDTLWKDWRKLWNEGPSRLRPVAVTGMRRSSPDRALDFLPKVVQHAMKRDEFPLGQILWGFGRDPNVEAGELATALGELSSDARVRCREALRKIGAKDEQIDGWVPAARPRSNHPPPWARMETVRITAPHRLVEINP
jgi:hypothetical protein